MKQAKFSYKALDVSGAIRSGQVTACNADAAMALLYLEKLTPIRLEENSVSETRKSFFDRYAVNRADVTTAQLLSITRQLASLLKAGLTLDRALTVAAELAPQKAEIRFFSETLEKVRRGLSFGEALRDQNLSLPSYYLGMIRAGENSGSLADSLQRLSLLLERAQKAREQVVSALIYPAILLMTIGLALLTIVSFVLPRFNSLFEEAGAELPFATQVVMALGDTLRHYGWFIAIGMASAAVAIERALQTPSLRLRLDQRLLANPVYTATFTKSDTSRFARTLAMLIGGGMTLPAAFRIALGTLRNHALRKIAEEALLELSAGKDLAAQLAKGKRFPPLLLQLVRVGLETGRLSECLHEAADILDEESARTTDRLISVLVPLVTVVMGALVAGLIGSVLVGILSLNDLAG